MFSFSIVLHVIAGFIALVTLWYGPLFFRKGGKYHRFTGWIFTTSMFIISGTSVHTAFYRIWLDPDLTTEQFSFYLFLIFIAILSFATAMYGLRVLKYKQHKGGASTCSRLGDTFCLVNQCNYNECVWVYRWRTFVDVVSNRRDVFGRIPHTLLVA